jgi:hypothetical protein
MTKGEERLKIKDDTQCELGIISEQLAIKFGEGYNLM